MEEQINKPAFSQKEAPETFRVLRQNKGIIIAIIIVFAAVVIGVSTLIGLKSKNQYQGLIKEIDLQLEEQNTEKQLVVPKETEPSYEDVIMEEIVPIPQPEQDKKPAEEPKITR